MAEKQHYKGHRTAHPQTNGRDVLVSSGERSQETTLIICKINEGRVAYSPNNINYQVETFDSLKIFECFIGYVIQKVYYGY